MTATTTATPATTAILFVDDEPDFEGLLRLQYRRQLRAGELEFEFASDGAAALAKLDARRFDLITTDINMPGMTGLELLHELTRRGNQIPVVVISAYVSPANLRAATDAGAAASLSKPIDFGAFDALRARLMAKAAEPARHQPSEPAADDALAGLGLLTAGVVHELKSPLSFVSTFAKLATRLVGELGDALPEDRRRALADQLGDIELALAKVIEHADWGLEVVSSILDGAGAASRDYDVVGMLGTHVELFAASMRVKHPGLDVQVETEFDPAISAISLAPRVLVRVLVNLLENGYHALLERQRHEPEPFRPVLAVGARLEGELVALCVSDNGIGFDTADPEQSFSPTYTTKSAGEGSGLGLHVVERIAEAHGGWVRAEANVPRGARVCFAVLASARGRDSAAGLAS